MAEEPDEGGECGGITVFLSLGFIMKNDVKRLEEMGDYLKAVFASNLLEEAGICVDSWEEGYDIEAVRRDNYEQFFKTEDGIRSADIKVSFPHPVSVSHVVLERKHPYESENRRF